MDYKKTLDSFYTKSGSDNYNQFKKETEYSKGLANIIGGRCEVKCPIGRIDILLDDLIVETKCFSTHGNKSAIGQVLSYQVFYPTRKCAIALIGSDKDYVVNNVCERYDIMYFYYWNNRWWV